MRDNFKAWDRGEGRRELQVLCAFKEGAKRERNQKNQLLGSASWWEAQLSSQPRKQKVWFIILNWSCSETKNLNFVNDWPLELQQTMLLPGGERAQSCLWHSLGLTLGQHLNQAAKRTKHQVKQQSCGLPFFNHCSQLNQPLHLLLLPRYKSGSRACVEVSVSCDT